MGVRCLLWLQSKVHRFIHAIEERRPKTSVTNDEILYRCLFSGMDMYKFRPDGTLEITSQAFADREDRRASVDRAKLCGNNPQHTLRDPKGGVVSIVAGEVRSIAGLSRNNKAGKSILDFTVEVEHVPLPENDAHAEIYTNPPFTDADKKVYRRLRIALAQLAEKRQCEIFPRSL
jgi:hypothetical protein